MLINDFLPYYDFVEHHSIIINAPVESVYPVIRALDFSGSSLIRWLFRLRGLLLWFVIRPFSAWIRREMLRTLKQDAEQSSRQSGPA